MDAEDITEGAQSQEAEQAAKQRAHPRFEVEADASLLLVSHDSWHPCRVLDLSLEGCRLSTAEVFRAGTQKHVEVSFRINGIAFRLSGTTQWTDGRHAVGIRFTYPTRRRKEELAEVLCEVEAFKAARAAQEAAEELSRREAAVEIPAPEEAEDARPDLMESPLISVQVSEEPLARVAELPEMLHGRERREHVRHEVDTTARIFLVHSGFAVNGRILNLSFGGCGIRTDESFPLGIYTLVEIQFHLNGLPFRLDGVVQFIYERSLVGIQFLELSERQRQRVEMLMAELEEHDESNGDKRDRDADGAGQR
jgi:hypothetical protein